MRETDHVIALQPFPDGRDRDSYGLPLKNCYAGPECRGAKMDRRNQLKFPNVTCFNRCVGSAPIALNAWSVIHPGGGRRRFPDRDCGEPEDGGQADHVGRASGTCGTSRETPTPVE
ncbi:hypothetical protein ACFQS1_26365 [Paractinoplanes rhizophilus]|jgi:hypothetical protein|uniref:Uncharacterized protein n=1 Tax=Paractinoplanes rhizophilus TaxID=1416877 RepID=A0ABW2HWJ4_9ACTN|nr:hypothetical protein [Actinoplanes sp.]